MAAVISMFLLILYPRSSHRWPQAATYLLHNLVALSRDHGKYTVTKLPCCPRQDSARFAAAPFVYSL
jgi:hypothetical protein